MAEPTRDPDCERPEGCLLQDECFNGLCKYTAPRLFDTWPARTRLLIHRSSAPNNEVTMQQPICDLCGDPTDGYVCRRCTDETKGYLRNVVDLASEVETNVARQARYATRGGHRAAPVDDEDRGPTGVNRRQLVHSFGWPASKDRPGPARCEPARCRST
jgi:hypothetical protein